MTRYKQVTKLVNNVKDARINWHPGHMFSGIKAMIGKLNTVDCVIEIHDARLPFIGRNFEFKKHLGVIKPHLLVLNKIDLADLTKWKHVQARLEDQGDSGAMLTDLTGHDYTVASRGYDRILQSAINKVNATDRYNRQDINLYKIMIVGIPNVGKSTLINRLRQLHLGARGAPAKVGSYAGVTKSVNELVKVCSRPPIYCIDTPGVLNPGTTKNQDDAMRLALCSTINDSAVDPNALGRYLLEYLNRTNNDLYPFACDLSGPTKDLADITLALATKYNLKYRPRIDGVMKEFLDHDAGCWRFINLFRMGRFGRVMFT